MIKDNLSIIISVYKHEEVLQVQGREERGGRGDKKESRTIRVYVPTSHDKCTHLGAMDVSVKKI